MNDKQQYLLLRYSISEVSDVIEKHQAVINEHGYCWFGKLEIFLLAGYLTEFLKQRNHTFFYTVRTQRLSVNCLRIQHESRLMVYQSTTMRRAFTLASILSLSI